jgi:ADP-ribosyl-[dinitrogen reductase] hydrolase
MLGAIIGDIVGSRFEFANYKFKDFELFHENCHFTDDTVLTVAVADWLMSSDESVGHHLSRWTFKYPNCSYGAGYWRWVTSWDPKPYGSYGNGAAMRVSPVAWYGAKMNNVLYLADEVTKVTHNHPEGVKGAQATALAIYLARCGHPVSHIHLEIENRFGYNLNETVDQIRERYRYNETCQGTVPEAIACALQATDFEDAIRNAVSIGGDSDTVAAIAGSVAEACFGIPDAHIEKIGDYLPDEMIAVVASFGETVVPVPEIGQSVSAA